jgi:hypothetical protein
MTAMAAATILLAGCKDSASPTEPKMAATPLPPGGNVAGAWIGTYHDPGCDASAQASFEQTGSVVHGTLGATGPCGVGFEFNGTLQGNTLAGTVTDDEFHSNFSAQGILSGSTLEITIVYSAADNGQMHLHR